VNVFKPDLDMGQFFQNQSNPIWCYIEFVNYMDMFHYNCCNADF